jgi:hypothetical protein
VTISVSTPRACRRASCDEAHDALLLMYRMRYGHQVETMTTAEILDRWRRLFFARGPIGIECG